MSTLNQLRFFEKKMKDKGLDSKVHFFDSLEEYKGAVMAGRIRDNDVCIIDDITSE